MTPETFRKKLEGAVAVEVEPTFTVIEKKRGPGRFLDLKVEQGLNVKVTLPANVANGLVNGKFIA